MDIEITDNLSYQTGDRFLLCTDGFCSIIPENQLIEMISEEGAVKSIIESTPKSQFYSILTLESTDIQ